MSLQQYWNFIRPWYRHRVRWRAAGNCANWPVVTHEWLYGTIGAVTTNGTTVDITDATGHTLVDGLNVHRWHSWSGGDFNGQGVIDTAPPFYRIVLNCDAHHPHDVVAADLTGHDSNSFQVADDGTFSANHALSFFNGKKYILIESGHLNWSQVWPQRPNDGELWIGRTSTLKTLTVVSGSFTVTVVTASGSGTTTVLPNTITAGALQSAIGAIPSVNGKVQVKGIGPFTIVMGETLGNVNVSAAGATVTTPLNKIAQLSGGWGTNSWNGKNLMIRHDGKIRRISPSSNDDSIITLPGSFATAVPSTEFWVVENNAWFREPFASRKRTEVNRFGQEFTRITRGQFDPFAWHTGERAAFWSHFASDGKYGINTVNVFNPALSIARETITLTDGDAEDHIFKKDEVNHISFDTTWSGLEDTVVNPYAVQGVRFIQADIRRLLAGFLLRTALVSGSHSNMYTGDLAFGMALIGGQSGSTAVTANSSGSPVTAAIALPEGRTSYENVVWHLRDGRGMQVQGPGDNYYGTVANSGGSATWTGGGNPIDDTMIGYTLVYTLGEKRRIPRRVSVLYPVRHFVPETAYDEENNPLGLADPPTSEFPGSYENVLPSTNGAEYDDNGWLVDSGVPLINGTDYKYVGPQHPTTDDPYDPNDPLVMSPLTKYYDAAYSGRPTHESPLWQSTFSGVVTAVSGMQVKVDQHYWPSSAGKVSYYSAVTSGGVDNSTCSGMSADGRWLQSGRFDGMHFEVEISSGNWEERMISTHITTALTFTSAFSGTTVGKNFRLREPGGDGMGRSWVNFLKGRKFAVTNPNGSAHTFKIAGNSDEFIYLVNDGSGFTIQAGASYEVQFFWPGVTVRWNAATSEFISPPGWVGQEKKKVPGIYTMYGLLRCGDYPGDHIWDEIDGLHNLMFLVGGGATWDADGALNKKHSSIPSSPEDCDEAKDLLVSSPDNINDWNDNPPNPFNSDGEAPHSKAQLGYGNQAGSFIQKVWNKFTSAPFLCARFGVNSRTTYGFVFWTRDGADSDETAHHTFDTSVGLFRQWTQAGSVGPNGDAEHEITVGDTSLGVPSWPPCPSALQDNKSKGYYAYRVLAVHDFSSYISANEEPDFP